MSDGSREAYNNWRNGWKALETGAPPVFEIWDTAWKQAWQAAKADTPPSAEVNQQLLEALKLISEHDISGADKRSMQLILLGMQNLAEAAILAAQSKEPDTKTLITDTKKWRVDDLVVDIKGNIYIIEGVKANSFLVKDSEDNLYLMPADELTWHSRPQQEPIK